MPELLRHSCFPRRRVELLSSATDHIIPGSAQNSTLIPNWN
jgi:hypothetical protein